MCSNEWVLTPEDFGLSARHFRIHGHQLVEAMPDRCPAGHVLGRNNVLVSNYPCVGCTGRSHRLWRCRSCDACWVWPACTMPPPGVNGAVTPGGPAIRASSGVPRRRATPSRHLTSGTSRDGDCVRCIQRRDNWTRARCPCPERARQGNDPAWPRRVGGLGSGNDGPTNQNPPVSAPTYSNTCSYLVTRPRMG